MKCNQSDSVLGGAVWWLQTERRMLHEGQSIGFLNDLVLSAIVHKQHWHWQMFKRRTSAPIFQLQLLFLCSVCTSLTHARYRWVSNENKSHMKCLPRLPEQLQTCSSAGRINTISPEDFSVVMVAITVYPMGPKSPRVHMRLDPLSAKDIAHDSNPFSSLSDPLVPCMEASASVMFFHLFVLGLPQICRPSSVFKVKATVSPSPLLFTFLQRIPRFLRALCGSPQIIKVWISRYLLAMTRVACSSVMQAGWDISVCLMCRAVKVGQTCFVSHDIWKISFHGKSFRHSTDARTMGIITQGVNPWVPLCSPHWFFTWRCCSLGFFFFFFF